jgi:hypothetical protein
MSGGRGLGRDCRLIVDPRGPVPFTHEQFLDVFGAYNRALWPAVALLWLATLVVMVAHHRRGAAMTRTVVILLAVHWLWSGIAYHLVHFRTVNPAATIFGALFVAQAGLLLWRGLARTGFALSWTTGWARAGMALVAVSLAYPALGLMFGLTYPRLPLFAVPCPTTLLTIGVLLAAPRREARWLAGIPLLWAGIGTSAAITLGMTADLTLAVAGVLLLAYVTTREGSARS